jgi:hypothetical protein
MNCNLVKLPSDDELIEELNPDPNARNEKLSVN